MAQVRISTWTWEGGGFWVGERGLWRAVAAAVAVVVTAAVANEKEG